ncbi:endogenous retrovirus group K member 113 Gag polyprotein-like, partial [Centrocercus urophasianus]|uniref:endogenous retrovirus group K member 113 Gag polyprotein-like n=1 Tax=Centrocercus urophasianus TaxID=9002 RepID=UPI001C6537B8
MALTPSAPPETTTLEIKKNEVEQERSYHKGEDPPPYPACSVYPSLKPCKDNGEGGSAEEFGMTSSTVDKKVLGEGEMSGGVVVRPVERDSGGGTHLLPESACYGGHPPRGVDGPALPCGGRGAPTQIAPGSAQEGRGPISVVSWGPPTLTDWARVREDIRAADPARVALTLPVVVKPEGPAWTPLDSKAITRLSDLVKSKGLRSPVTMAAVEALMASSLLPYDVVNFMHVILEPVQYTLWYDEWNRLLQAVVAAATRDHRHPANGQGRGDRTSLARLQSLADGMVGSPEGQAALLRAGELAAVTTAALQALRELAKVVEPVLPWADIKQGPFESFSDFANRLIRAVEGSDLPSEVQSPVIIDCLKQKSLPEIQQIIRAAPGTLTTPGELIKYVLDHQRVTPLTNEGLVATMQGMAASANSAVKTAMVAATRAGEGRDKGPCFKCGQRGHFKAQCPKKMGQGLEKRCQLCGGAGHVAPLLDSGADITVTSEDDWPRQWPATFMWRAIAGVGGDVPTRKADRVVELAIINDDGSMEKN